MTLSQNSYLCELHFKEEDIIRCGREINSRGKLLQHPNKHTRLRIKDGRLDVTPVTFPSTEATGNVDFDVHHQHV